MSGPQKETPSTPPKPQPSVIPPSSEPPPPTAAPGTSTGASAESATSQASAAVGNAMSVLRQRLVFGEQLVLAAAAAIVVIVYLIFQFLLDYLIVSDFTVVVAALTVLAIWVHRWGHYDFGNGYRVLIGALGISLTLFAVINFLAFLRAGGGAGDALFFIGRIVYWISGLAAGYGAWLVFRLRQA
jgi:hypothetical protein